MTTTTTTTATPTKKRAARGIPQDTADAIAQGRALLENLDQNIAPAAERKKSTAAPTKSKAVGEKKSVDSKASATKPLTKKEQRVLKESYKKLRRADENSRRALTVGVAKLSEMERNIHEYMVALVKVAADSYRKASEPLMPGILEEFDDIDAELASELLAKRRSRGAATATRQRATPAAAATKKRKKPESDEDDEEEEEVETKKGKKKQPPSTTKRSKKQQSEEEESEAEEEEEEDEEESEDEEEEEDGDE
jgi:hypothetical protein